MPNIILGLAGAIGHDPAAALYCASVSLKTEALSGQRRRRYLFSL